MSSSPQNEPQRDAHLSPDRPRSHSSVVRRLRVALRRWRGVRFLRDCVVLLAREAGFLLLGIIAPLVGLAAYLHVTRDRRPLLLADGTIEVFLVASVALVASTWATRWILARRRRRIARRVGKALDALREKPSLTLIRSLADAGRRLEAPAMLDPLVTLGDAYRESLLQLVEMQGEFEILQGSHNSPARPGGDVAGPPTFPFERSRQQMVGRLTTNLHWQTATPLLQQVLGRSIERLSGRPFLRFVHPEDRERVQKCLTATLEEGESHNLVFRIMPSTQSGEEDPYQSPSPELKASQDAMKSRYFQADVLAYYDGDGNAEQLRCHFVDVTERVRADQILRQRTRELVRANERLQQINTDLERLKESYRDLYHHAPVMYFSLDERGRFAAVNETMLRALGWERDALLGQPYARILARESQAHYLSNLEILRTPGEIETTWQTFDGKERDVWIGISTVKEEGGGVARSRCAAADITERNHLAQAVVGRAQDLEKANAELRRINQELEEFSYVVSHDLKEPLRTLEAFSNFLATDYRDKLDEEGREYLSHLIGGSRRLGKLIDDLLALSWAGRVLGAPRLVDWTLLVETVLADLHLLITRRSGCQVRVEGPLPAVRGDPERLAQLLANLIGNALKYNESARPEVVIGAQQASGSQATLFVRDNGMGIDPRYHEQIFGIFRRLHRRDEYEGTGAGLAICKKIVEAHGGRLWVESAPGAGATFFFTLPRAEAEGTA